MNTLVKTDLEDLMLLLEDLVKRYPKLTRKERIDVAARLKPASKHLKAIDDLIKAEIKEIRDGVEGYVLGEMWRAKLSLIPVTRFQQTVFKEAEPKLYAKYSQDAVDERVTFESR